MSSTQHKSAKQEVKAKREFDVNPYSTEYVLKSISLNSCQRKKLFEFRWRITARVFMSVRVFETRLLAAQSEVQ